MLVLGTTINVVPDWHASYLENRALKATVIRAAWPDTSGLARSQTTTCEVTDVGLEMLVHLRTLNVQSLRVPNTRIATPIYLEHKHLKNTSAAQLCSDEQVYLK